MKLRLTAHVIHGDGTEDLVASECLEVVVGRDVAAFQIDAQQVLHITAQVLLETRKPKRRQRCA